MTTIMEKEGIIVLPPHVCRAASLHEGEAVEVMVATNGEIRLRKKATHRQSLLEHLEGMAGLGPVRDREPLKAPSVL